MRLYIPFELPSNGKLVTPHKGFIGNAEGLEQLERTAPAIAQDQIIAELIQKALKEDYWDVGNLTAPDFTYLKVMYSIATYGNRLLYPMVCPYCGKEIKYISLKDLKQKKLEEMPDKIKRIPSNDCMDFYDESGDEVEIRIPSIREKWEVLAEGATAHATIMAVSSAIEKVNGKRLTSLEKEIYVQELSQAQKRVILARVDKLTDFGIISSFQETVCECKKTVGFPFSVATRQLFFPTLG